MKPANQVSRALSSPTQGGAAAGRRRLTEFAACGSALPRRRADMAPDTGSKPLLGTPQSRTAAVALWLFVIAPFVALVAAVPVAWGWGLSPLDAAMAVIGYLVSG